MNLKNYLNEALPLNEAIEQDPEEIYNGFKKIQLTLDLLKKSDKVSEFFDRYRSNLCVVVPEFSANIFKKYINWCIIGYKHSEDTKDWFSNIVNNPDQFRDIYEEDDLASTSSDDFDVVDEVVAELVPMAYKKIVGKTINLWR